LIDGLIDGLIGWKERISVQLAVLFSFSVAPR